jgi:hypothetical protein
MNKRVLVFGFVGLVLSSGFLACQPGKGADERKQEYEEQARGWCKLLGVPITGVNCYADGYCDVAPVNGAPFKLTCAYRGWCYLPER